MKRTVVVWLFAVAFLPASGAGAQGRQISLEANPFHGTLALGWQRTGTRYLGVELGFGFPQLNRTLVPDDDTLNDFFHVGAFSRWYAGSFALCGRVKLGLAELDGCSGCVPGALAATSAGLFWGGQTVKVGAQLTAGVLAERGNDPAFVLDLTPFAVLITFGW